MKKIFITAIVAIVLAIAGCTKPDYDEIVKGRVEGTAPTIEWNDSIVSYRPVGSSEKIELLTRNGQKLEWGNPFNIKGNAFVRQGTTDLATSQNSVAVTAAPILWPYNHSIVDTIGRVQDTIEVTILSTRPDGRLDKRVFRVAPESPLKISVAISHTHPSGAAGFVDNAKMEYTLADSRGAWCCRWASKATIYEVVDDTVFIDTTTRRVVSRSADWRHMSDCGEWGGTGATRTITLHCWCVESTLWSDGTVDKDSVLVAGHGSMTWSFPVYTGSVDGNYGASANGCTAIQATCHTSWTYDIANFGGRTYTHTASCALQPTQVSVVGTTATITTAHDDITRTAQYDLTIVLPPDTIDVFHGQIKYAAWHYSAVDYHVGAAGDGRFLLIITNDNSWYTSPEASTAAGLNLSLRGTMSQADYDTILSRSNFTAADQSGQRCCAAWCRNSVAGISGVLSTVKYDPNNGNPQLKYFSMSGELIGACSAASGAIHGHTVPEPVGDGGVTNTITFSDGILW